MSPVCFVIEWQTKPTLIGLLTRAHKEAALATVLYGTPEGAFLFQYLPEKKAKQKELGRYLSQVFDAFVFIRKHSDIFSGKSELNFYLP